MKSRVNVLAAAAVALFMGVSLSHAITVQDTNKVTATVTTGGTAASNVSIAIKDTDNPFGADQSAVTWPNTVTPASGWTVADQLIVVVATVTDAGGGVRTYFNNTNGAADPQYVGAVANPAGLLLDDGSPTSDADPLPTAWSIKSSTRIVEGGTDVTGVGAADPNTGSETPGSFNNRFQWLFHLDQVAPAFSDTNKFTYTHNVTGIHFGQADSEFGAHPDGAPAYMYIEADFSGAAAAQAYKTTELIVESFLE